MVTGSEMAAILLDGRPCKFYNKFGKEYLSIVYYQKLQAIVSSWKGFVTPEDIIQCSTVKLEMMRELPILGIINDNRELEGPWYDANDWIEKTWLPEAINLGIKRLAQVLSPDAYAAISAQEMLNAIEKQQSPVQVGAFVSVAEAKDWVGAAVIEIKNASIK